MSDEFDWLDDAPAEKPADSRSAVTNADLAIATVSAERRAKRVRRPSALVKAESAITSPQRYYLRCLIESETLKQANRAFHDSGYKYSRTTLHRWRQNPKFIKALHLAQDYAFEALGINRNKVLLDAEKMKELALTPRPVLYKGAYTGFDEIEIGAALRALELQAKGVGIGDGDKQRVVVAIDIDFSGRRDDVGVTIDGESELVDDG